MLKYIKECTETEAQRQLNDPNWKITFEELEAFIAVLYARGAYGAEKLELDTLWSTNWGPAFLQKTMSRNRFREIMKYLRLDVKSTRSSRLQTDKFALASEIWDKFISNCKICYIPGTDITIDEQLFPSKSRCRFTQYMPNKILARCRYKIEIYFEWISIFRKRRCSSKTCLFLRMLFYVFWDHFIKKVEMYQQTIFLPV